MKWDVKNLAIAAMIAALYIVLTGVFSSIGFGMVQIRVSEALYALALFTPVSIVGLGVGCLVSNILWSPFFILDWVLGTFATVLGAFLVYLLRNKKAPFSLTPPVFTNGVLVALVMNITQGLPFLASMIYVALGEAIACVGLGYLLYQALDRMGAKRFLQTY